MRRTIVTLAVLVLVAEGTVLAGVIPYRARATNEKLAPHRLGQVDLGPDFVAADGYEVMAFVPTGPYAHKNRCLATLAESDFAVAGTTIYCAPRLASGDTWGLYIHIFLPTPVPSGGFIFTVTLYQRNAVWGEQPIPCSQVGGC